MSSETYCSLLMEVSNLVEWPTALAGSFEEIFLELPDEVLVTSMAVHQRYFPVFEKGGLNLLPNFITIRNGNERGLDTVRQGNERVTRARLSDARFFYQEDQKVVLADFEKIDSVFVASLIISIVSDVFPDTLVAIISVLESTVFGRTYPLMFVT